MANLLGKISPVRQAQGISDRGKAAEMAVVPLQSQRTLLMTLTSGMKERFQKSMLVTTARIPVRDQSLISSTGRQSLQRMCTCRSGNKSHSSHVYCTNYLLSDFLVLSGRGVGVEGCALEAT
jgi:hypothetical protein